MKIVENCNKGIQWLFINDECGKKKYYPRDRAMHFTLRSSGRALAGKSSLSRSSINSNGEKESPRKKRTTQVVESRRDGKDLHWSAHARRYSIPYRCDVIFNRDLVLSTHLAFLQAGVPHFDPPFAPPFLSPPFSVSWFWETLARLSIYKNAGRISNDKSEIMGINGASGIPISRFD